MSLYAAAPATSSNEATSRTAPRAQNESPTPGAMSKKLVFVTKLESRRCGHLFDHKPHLANDRNG